jgi:23S rRNA (adenine1618-N6)-methyltransferase
MSKSLFHARNRHSGHYDFARYTEKSPALAAFVRPNPEGDSTIDFADPDAVKALNRAILLADYDVAEWDIPEGYLCPAIPGRADYVHAAADLLGDGKGEKPPTGAGIRVLDIGTGANLVYPLIGRKEYDWTFVGSEVDPIALESGARILRANPGPASGIELRRQSAPGKIFEGIVLTGEHFHLVLCNPPFHASREEAAAGTRRKWKNLGKGKRSGAPSLNFGGRETELVSRGGERGFVLRMIEESRSFARQIDWFTALVSKEANLPAIEQALMREKSVETRLIEMHQGRKKSRVVAWRFETAKRPRAEKA